MFEQARSEVQIDNDWTRVTEWILAPNTATGHHTHEFDYVVVPLTGGQLLIRSADGDNTATTKPGESYARRKGVSHDVINPGETEIRFIEIEFKR